MVKKVEKKTFITLCFFFSVNIERVVIFFIYFLFSTPFFRGRRCEYCTLRSMCLSWSSFQYNTHLCEIEIPIHSLIKEETKLEKITIPLLLLLLLPDHLFTRLKMTE